MDMREREEKEKHIERKYSTNKNIVHQWEATVFKTQGCQPGKDDLKLAPKSVREAYSRYFKYRKQLIKFKEETERKQKKRNGQGSSTTPQKIFKGLSCAPTSNQKRKENEDNAVTNVVPVVAGNCKKTAYLANLSGKLSMKHKLLRLSTNKCSKLPEAQDEIEGGRTSNLTLDDTRANALDGVSNSNCSNLSLSSAPDSLVLTEGEGACDTSEEQESMESFCNTLNFDAEEEDRILVPSQLYSNFLEGYKNSPSPPGSEFNNSKTMILPNSKTCLDLTYQSENSSSGSSSVFNGNIGLYSNSISTPTRDSGRIDDDIDEQVQSCIRSVPDFHNESSSSISSSLFPISSFVLTSINASDVHAELAEPLKNIEMTPSNEVSSVSTESEPYFPSIATMGPSSSSSFPSQTLNSTTSPTNDKNNKENQIKKKEPSSPVKRKFSYAFSPSPEKLPPKKKFFKSDRKTNTRHNHSLRSFRPVIPDEAGSDVSSKKGASSISLTSHPSKPTLTLLEIPSKLRSSVTKVTEEAKTDVAMEFDSDYDITQEPLGSNESSEEEAYTPSSKTRKSVASKANRQVSAKKNERIAPKRRSSTRGQNVNKAAPSTAAAGLPDHFDPDRPGATPVIDAFDIVGKGESSKGGKARGGPRNRPKRTKGLNDNYVAIDITRKVFVRGKKTITGAKVKRADWKKKKSLAGRDCKLKSLTCNKCGDLGHFARFCSKVEVEKDLVPKDELIDDSPWPTLEEASKMVWSKAAAESQLNRTEVFQSQNVDGDDVVNTEDTEPKDSLSEAPCSFSSSTNVTPSSSFTVVNPYVKRLDPYYNDDGGMDAEGLLEEDMKNGLKHFGYDDFRSGQREAITRVLKGESTLLMLSTGSGKSLCYQLPAYMYAKKYPGALTICISPLISLMEDQVDGMPRFLNAAFIHYNMTEKKKAIVIESIKKQTVNILLVSAEAICGGLFGLFKDVGQLPPIAFACIDEVHCVSEWSHNFRPSYLQVCKLLREKLNVKTILGLTATATTQTCASICDQLQIHTSSVIRGELIPKNLNLSVSRDDERDVALIQLLMGDRFLHAESIIIYCTRREECNRISELIRTHIKDPKFNSIGTTKYRSRVSTNCEAYHAGLSGFRRNTIQKQFMQGKIRIVVATIAFGMGIDKSDIRSVIHYNMPQTFESYVQEIGRAGRDGLEANCHLFLDNIKGRDLSELKRHVFANSIDRVTIRKLIRRLFKPCKCKRVENSPNGTDESRASSIGLNGRCPGHEVSFSMNDTVQDLDIPEENIDTLLCYLENDKSRKWMEILPKTYEICKIHSYGGAKLLKACALKCPPLAVAVALEKEKKTFRDTDVYLEFNVIEAAAAVGWNSAVVRRELKSLEWIGSEYNKQGKPTKFRKSGIMVEFGELAFRCRAPGDLTDKEYDAVFSSLCEFNSTQERRQLYQLHKVYQSLYSVSCPKVTDAADTFNEEFSATLKNFIYEYFQQENAVPVGWRLPQCGLDREEDIRRETRILIQNYQDTKFTGRAVAKLFQGIGSPCFPTHDWCRNRAFWRRFLDVDFHLLSKLASEEILSTAY